jgi:hypothetical protein
MNYSPRGKVSRINLDKATVILSGLKHLKTQSFLKGVWSSLFHSRGNLTSYGVSSLYQSLNLGAASFSILIAKVLNSSN